MRRKLLKMGFKLVMIEKVLYELNVEGIEEAVGMLVREKNGYSHPFKPLTKKPTLCHYCGEKDLEHIQVKNQRDVERVLSRVP